MMASLELTRKIWGGQQQREEGEINRQESMAAEHGGEM